VSDAGWLFGDRQRADSFGDNAAQYDRVRPTYPAEMIDMLVADNPRTALDVGCGTAIAGRLLVARGLEVLGLEPDQRMATVARGHGIAVEEATFEDWNSRTRTFDLLTAGQAWHWVDPHAGAMKAARVLVPGGRIGLFWNQPQPDGPARQAMDVAYAQHAPLLAVSTVLLGQRDISLYEGMAAALRQTGRFESVALSMFEHRITYETEQWLSLTATHSDHHTLPADQLASLLLALRQGLEAVGGRFSVRYETVLVGGQTVIAPD
jgi:SAM-dependent methyltransferase